MSEVIDLRDDLAFEKLCDSFDYVPVRNDIRRLIGIIRQLQTERDDAYRRGLMRAAEIAEEMRDKLVPDGDYFGASAAREIMAQVRAEAQQNGGG